MEMMDDKKFYQQIEHSLKAHGVEDVFFISMDGVSGLEQGFVN